MQRQHSATVAGPREPVSAAESPAVRSPSASRATEAVESTPQVLARIPSLADELPDEDPVAEDAGQSRLLGSRASLKILAAVGGALFLLALWGFVFDRNKSSKEEASGPVSAREPFRPSVPAPNAPEAPRWTGLPAGSEPHVSGNQGPISAEARPAPPDAPMAAEGSRRGSPLARTDRDPMPWTLSQGSAAPASPAWNGQDAVPSEPVPDWTTQPYPSTADRTRPPTWDTAPSTGLGSRSSPPVAGGPRPEMSPSEAVARSAVNPVYRDDRDPTGPAPAAYTDPSLGGSRWPAADTRPTDAAQPAPASTNRPVSLAQRPSLDRQLPSPAPGSSRDVPNGWSWSPPVDGRAPSAPAFEADMRQDLRDDRGARPEAVSPFRSPGPNDYQARPPASAITTPGNSTQGLYGPQAGSYSAPAADYSPGGATYRPASGSNGPYTPGSGDRSGPAPGGQRGANPAAAGMTTGPVVPWNPRDYGTPQSAPATSPTPPSNPYHNLLPMYQAPAGQPGSPAAPYGDAYRYGPAAAAGQATGPATTYGSPTAPWGGNSQAPNAMAYPPNYSLPVNR